MKLIAGFELPAIFSRLSIFGHPPVVNNTEDRRASDAITHPFVQFYNPEGLHFPDHNKPTVPGAGGYISCGIGMVVYDRQPHWDRSMTNQAGPVREFFRDLIYDNRVKHI